MIMGGGGGDPGGDARRAEADRQARITAATDQINNIFSGATQQTRTRQVPGVATPGTDGSWQSVDQGDHSYNQWVPGTATTTAAPTTQSYTEWVPPAGGNPREAMYADQRKAVYDVNSQEVNRQALEAGRTNRFGLARAGLAGGSTDINSNAELNRRTNEGLLRAGGIADQSGADLRTADERTRANLISMAQSGIDTGSAATMALGGLKSNVDSVAAQRSGSTIDDLFGNISAAYLANQTNQGRAAGMNQGAQFYGVSDPNKKYAGR
jgi:hypothetical protein